MIYAQILNGVVINIIVLEDQGLIPIFSQGIDQLIPIPIDPGSPSIGWLYDQKSQLFSPPQNPDTSDAISIKELVKEVLIEDDLIPGGQ